jgi:hypothetical protein
VEFAREELEPLLQLQSARGGSGPFAATGEPEAAILDAVRRSSKPATSAYVAEAGTGPGAAGGGTLRPHRQTSKRPVSHPLTGGARPPSVKPPPVLSANDNRDSPLGLARGRTPIPGTMPSVTGNRGPAAGSGKRRDGPRAAPPTRDDLRPIKLLEPPKIVLSDTLRLGISAALRAFPEVEWACVVSDESTIPVIGVRVDPSFLNRVTEITDGILGASEKQGIELQVLLLNNADLVKSAHKHGHAFYPWRK